MATNNSYLNYRCAKCKRSSYLPDSIDHKCKECGARLVRSTHAEKKYEKARLEVASLYEMYKLE